MKRLLLVLSLIFLLGACGSGSGKGFKDGDEVTVSQKCIWASDEESFSEMNKLCNQKDEMGLEKMESLGKVGIVLQGTKCVVTESGFGKSKIRLDNGREVWVSSEFLK